MRMLAPLALGLALIGSAAWASDPATDTANAVRAADLAFAKRAAEAGTPQAFREYMDPVDSLEFSAGPPAHGADAIFQALGGDKPAKSRLAWTPTDAWGAASGELGVTTGTWASTAIDGSRPPIMGRYVTVWRKDASGHWKGLIDIGTTDKP